MRRLIITKSRLDCAVLARAVASPKHGAVAIFIGAVRSTHAGRRVLAIAYDCFVPLAEKELALIAQKAEKLWPVRVALSHRIGRLPVGAASVVVAVGSGHRTTALDACRFVIDEIKRGVPIWKNERYAKGRSRWLPGCVLRRHRS